jgi:hypothetical protein
MKWTALPVRCTARATSLSTSTWWALTLAYYVSCCLMHLQFSLWLVRQRDTLVGRLAYADAMPGLVIGGAAALLVWLVIRLRNGARPRLTIAFWLLWLATVALIDHYLIFSINEYAHYPEYALLAWLVARAMDPQRTRWYVGRVLFWTTLLGMGDELLQYLWITISYSEYLDFNDFVTNAVAAAAGMLLYYGTAPRSLQHDRRAKPVVESGVAIALTLLVALAMLSGRVVQTPATKVPPGGIVLQANGKHQLSLQRGPDFYGAWQSSQRHERYYVLPPLPGLLIMLMAGLVFAGYGKILPGADDKTGQNLARNSEGELNRAPLEAAR